MPKLRLLPIILLMLWYKPALASSLALSPFEAVYRTTYNLGVSIDVKAQRSLSQKPDGTWVLDFHAKNWFAKIQQTSTFNWGEDNHLMPLLYRRYQSVFGNSKEQRVIFHWDNMQVTNDIDNKPWLMNILPGTQDLLSYQLKLRYDLQASPEQKDFVYEVADGGKVKTFTFRVIGEETINTPMGQLNSIKIESLRHSEKDVEHLIWLAKDWDNMLVRVEAVRKRDEEEPIVLHSATVNGIQMKGF
ncbi:Protein of unknown function [Oceanospirillum multiglobuliferum]|uniref:DUF3108 domain-containing protein n=1 Tax=Oceanospirillum multiglobuliferum TaxID=64969 RepID=A0A1T4NBB4_9GAMM|nr:DUF3108 domain-containing protein [Oceanospirillum multiglobuliferum]OPX55907.1 hypothetical protein BTE48_06860 [Oceanospirillum multiglobuliferum]SJZ76514.1 Protein of unknown function [Oceanospirillum multiglobuliferum]